MFSGLQISDGDENWRAPRDPMGGLVARATSVGLRGGSVALARRLFRRILMLRTQLRRAAAPLGRARSDLIARCKSCQAD